MGALAISLLSVSQSSSLITLHITLAVAMLCCAVAYTNVFAHLSDHTTSERQGEVMGLGVSVQCLAEWLPPLCVGIFIAANPAIPMISGSIAALIGLATLLKH